MKVRPGFVVSSASHAALLAWGLLGLSSAKPFDVGPTEALPIEIISPEQFDAMTKGSKTSKKVEAPKVKADKVAEADPDPVDDTTPVAKEEVKAPPAAAPPPTAEAPPPPEPKPDPAVAKAAADAQAKAEAAKAAEAKAAQDKAAADKAAKAAADKAAQEKAEKFAEAADAERLAKAQAEQASKKAEAEKAAAEKAAKAEADKAAKEQAAKLAKVEADKAAKAEADRLAKAEKAKADAAKAAKAKETKFDASKIASLLGEKSSQSDSALKDVRDASRKAASARETAPETTAGTAKGAASKLSVSQRTGIDNAVREQVMQCWNPPVGAASDGSLAVRVSFTLNADGTLSSPPQVTNSSSNPAFRAASGAATRAVQRCAPLKLPAEAYDYWRTISINFDPKDMMGG